MKSASLAPSNVVFLAPFVGAVISPLVLLEAMARLGRKFGLRWSGVSKPDASASRALKSAHPASSPVDGIDKRRDPKAGRRHTNAVLDSLPDSIVVCEGDVVVQANAAALRLTGSSHLSQLHGRRIENLLPGLESQGQSTACWCREAVVRTACGRDVPVELSIISMPCVSKNALSFRSRVPGPRLRNQ